MDFSGFTGVWCGPTFGGTGWKGGGGAQLVGSMSPSGLRRGWVEVGRGLLERLVSGVNPIHWGNRLVEVVVVPRGGKDITRRVGER
eukprot:scaffold1580_cov196-Isochrysis_galbana.AAC.1